MLKWIYSAKIVCDILSINNELIFSFQLTPEIQKDILEKVWLSDSCYVFPSTGKHNLQFQHNWLQKWKWLFYSEVAEGAFCKYCSPFATDGAGSGSQRLHQLVREPLKKWKKAIEEFNGHQSKKCHQESVVRAQ